MTVLFIIYNHPGRFDWWSAGGMPAWPVVKLLSIRTVDGVPTVEAPSPAKIGQKLIDPVPTLLVGSPKASSRPVSLPAVSSKSLTLSRGSWSHFPSSSTLPVPGGTLITSFSNWFGRISIWGQGAIVKSWSWWNRNSSWLRVTGISGALNSLGSKRKPQHFRDYIVIKRAGWKSYSKM